MEDVSRVDQMKSGRTECMLLRRAGCRASLSGCFGAPHTLLKHLISIRSMLQNPGNGSVVTHLTSTCSYTQKRQELEARNAIAALVVLITQELFRCCEDSNLAQLVSSIVLDRMTNRRQLLHYGTVLLLVIIQHFTVL